MERLRQIASTKPRYTWYKSCIACQSNFRAWRKTQSLCSECYKCSRTLKESKATNNYISTKTPGLFLHRQIAEELIGRKLNTNEVVHHLDENPQNNDLTNLIVLSRYLHGKLHLYLDVQRVILEKSKNENIENCWNNLRVPMTTA